MKEVETDMREAAVRYFEGCLSAQDEERLYRFIQESGGNYSLFKEWERQWLETSVANERTEFEWEKLQARLHTRKAVTPMLLPGVGVFWRKIAAVVAIVILTAGATLGIGYTVTCLQPETYFTLEVPFGEKSKITLSDGTNVWLNSGSKLIYSNRFDKENRVVKLEGEGYFEVTRHEGIPFKVETPAYAVLVKGTKFNVSAYSGDPYVTTTLLEGKVELLHEKNIYKIVPGESMRLNVATGRLQKTKVDATHSTAWLKNQVEFERITLKELAMKLSRQYNVQIRIASEALGSKAFRISLRNRETIGEVMKALQEIMPVTIEYKEDNIYIKE